MTSLRPSIMQGVPDPRGGRLPSSSLPPHLAGIKLPSGRTIGTLKNAELAKLCIHLGVAGADHHHGNIKNAQLLADVLEAIGREAAEKAIAAHLAAKLGTSR